MKSGNARKRRECASATRASGSDVLASRQSLTQRAAMTFSLFSSWSLQLLACPFLFLFAYYVHFKLVGSKYWKNRNVFHEDPVFLFGNNWQIFFSENIGFIFEERYRKWKEKKLVGFWSLVNPSLLVTDVDLVKRILVRDFNHFRDRTININEDMDPLAGHLVNLKGSKWRNLRVKLTPTFTSGKMKMMFPIMVECGTRMQKLLAKVADDEDGVELKEILARFTTDIIASCAFGIETNCLENPDAEFRSYGKKIFQPSFGFVMRFILTSVFPRLRDLLKVKTISQDVEDFFIKIVRETMDYREQNQIERNDFMQLLIQLKNKGKVDDADSHPLDNEEKEPGCDQKFTLNQAAAQAFVFFAAGFETSSTTLSFAFYELAVNPQVQSNLQNEIDYFLSETDGEITYDVVGKMEYLDWVIQETLRKYPPLTFLARQCTKDYEIPDLAVKLDKGSRIVISLLGIQKDPRYFPDPEKFDPIRFSPEEKAKRDHFTSLPFGEGPRNCIGSRFGLLQTKVGLVSVLTRYNVEMCKNTPFPLLFNKRAFILTPAGEVLLKVTRRSLKGCAPRSSSENDKESGEIGDPAVLNLIESRRLASTKTFNAK